MKHLQTANYKSSLGNSLMLVELFNYLDTRVFDTELQSISNRSRKGIKYRKIGQTSSKPHPSADEKAESTISLLLFKRRKLEILYIIVI